MVGLGEALFIHLLALSSLKESYFNNILNVSPNFKIKGEEKNKGFTS